MQLKDSKNALMLEHNVCIFANQIHTVPAAMILVKLLLIQSAGIKKVFCSEHGISICCTKI